MLSQTDNTNVLLSPHGQKGKEHYPILTHDTFEDCVPFGQEMGVGELKTLKVSQYIQLLYINFTPKQDLFFEVENQKGWINISFVLESEEVPLIIDDIQELAICGGENWISGPATYSAAKLYGKSPVKSFTLWIHPDLVYDYLREDSLYDSSKILNELFEGKKNKSYVNIDLNEPEMRIIILQILNYPDTHPLKKTYIEGKVLELMALRLDQILRKERCRFLCPELNQTDLEKMYYVRKILLKNISEPPTLSELAIKVATNTSKLKSGFKRVFGQSVFSYLRDKRLEYARSLLLENEKNISEIAYITGYWDISAFNKAFNQKYGMRPSLYKNSLFN